MAMGEMAVAEAWTEAKDSKDLVPLEILLLIDEWQEIQRNLLFARIHNHN